MKTLFLLSHYPIPRFVKRMEVSRNVSKTELLIWDRQLDNDIMFSLPENVRFDKIKLRAPQGKAIQRSFLLVIFMIRALKKIVKINPDNLHVGNIDMLFVAYFYKQIFNRKVNIIYEIGDLPEIALKDNFVTNIYKQIEKLFLKKVKYVILTSPYFWKNYYNDLFDKDKYYFIPNVPSKQILTYKSSNIPLKNKKQGLTIGFIGSVRYAEQLKMLVDSVKNRKSTNLIISGAGNSLDELVSYAKEFDNIIFTGSYNYKQIGSLYEQVDITFSVYDTKKKNVRIALPNRLYESILYEKPLIVSHNTELSKFVLGKGIGFSVSDKEFNELDFLIDYIEKTPEIIEYKKHKCKSIKSHYYYEKYTPVIESFYK